MAAGGAVAVAGGGTLTDNDGEIAGVPATIVLFSIIEGIFFAAAWLYACVKHKADLSSLGFVRTQGIRPYVSAGGYWLLAAGAVGLWAVAVRSLNIDPLLPPDSAEEALDVAGGSVLLAIALVGVLGRPVERESEPAD